MFLLDTAASTGNGGLFGMLGIYAIFIVICILL